MRVQGLGRGMEATDGLGLMICWLCLESLWEFGVPSGCELDGITPLVVGNKGISSL